MKTILALMLLITPVSAKEVLAPLPPIKYDKPYKGKLTVIHTDNVIGECGGWALACAYWDKGWCKVVLPKKESVSKAQYARLWRHEIGHCNGWPGDHPGARP